MSELTDGEVAWLLRTTAGDGQWPMTWNEPQARAIIGALHQWVETRLPELKKLVEDAAPGATDESAKERFLKAYMSLRGIGIPERRWPDDYFKDVEAARRELEAQTDRGVAIVGPALMDDKLRTALELYLIPGLSAEQVKNLFEGPTSPFGTYSGRVRVTHAFGLVGPDTFADLQLIGSIRNKFAHRLSVKSFSEPEIAERCSRLKLAEVRGDGEPPFTDPRQRFIRSIMTAMNLLLTELIDGSGIGHPARKSP